MFTEKGAPPKYLQYLEGGGEMGSLTRAYDWSQTSAGSPDEWPDSLLSILSIMLNSKLPMFLWWGDDLVQFYNDAYRPSLVNTGKHPTALGQKGEECCPEIWPVISPLIQQVRSGGEAVWNEDALIPIYRNDHLEDVYWTFGYSAVRNGSQEIAGVLVTCYETTEKVKAQLELQATASELAERESKLRYMLNDAPVAIAILTGRDLIIESANQKILEIWGKSKSVIGMPLSVALPELKGQPYLKILDDVFNTGNPFSGDEAKVLLEREGQSKHYYVNFVYHPIKDKSDVTTSIMVVANDVTEQLTPEKTLKGRKL